MKTDNMIMELDVLECKIERLQRELAVHVKRRETLINNIEDNLITDIFEAKN